MAALQGGDCQAGGRPAGQREGPAAPYLVEKDAGPAVGQVHRPEGGADQPGQLTGEARRPVEVYLRRPVVPGGEGKQAHDVVQVQVAEEDVHPPPLFPGNALPQSGQAAARVQHHQGVPAVQGETAGVPPIAQKIRLGRGEGPPYPPDCQAPCASHAAPPFHRFFAIISRRNVNCKGTEGRPAIGFSR